MKKSQKKRKATIKFLKRQHFQLLEIMVAVFILLTCAAPAIRIYTNIYIQEQNIIRENQRDHLVHRIHAFLTEQLYKKTISFQQISTDMDVPLQDSELQADLAKINYEGLYQFSQKKGKKTKGATKPHKYLVMLTIKLRDLSSLKKSTETKFKTEHGDSSEVHYDYLIYIDASKEKNIMTQIEEDVVPLNLDLEEENEEGTAPCIFFVETPN